MSHKQLAPQHPPKNDNSRTPQWDSSVCVYVCKGLVLCNLAAGILIFQRQGSFSLLYISLNTHSRSCDSISRVFWKEIKGIYES